MDKIYGYKEEDVIGLAKFLSLTKEKNLTNAFKEYASSVNKAPGTVRNLYYALARKSNQSQEFCDKYLNGKKIEVHKIVEFEDDEEIKLIKRVLVSKSEGRSVRSAIMEMAKGDGKLALRYQNKFRNAMKNKRSLILKLSEELCLSSPIKENNGENITSIVSDNQFNKLKAEINGLVGRISVKIRRENQYLKQRIATLERENLKLCNLLYGSIKPTDARRFFDKKDEQENIN